MIPAQSLFRIYGRLPGWARSAAATVHGLRLHRWRYGPDFERVVAEALQRESWPPERWQEWIRERLNKVLLCATTRVPWYRNQWSNRLPPGGSRPWEALESWPVLEKESLRNHAHAFLADGADPRRLYLESTSGTTGKPLHLWLSRDAVQSWYALAEARWRRWYGVSNQDRWAMLGGQLVTPVCQTKPPFWVWNASFRQLYMSSYHLNSANGPHYLHALKRFKVRYLLGYSSSLATLAAEALRARFNDIHLKVVISNAEPLLAHQREIIATAFRCPVRETYGMSENVAAAGECEHGRMHLWPEAGWLEVMDSEGRIHQQGCGELLCTGFLNPDMPLIRYRIGDVVTLGGWECCPCGRSLPLLASVQGRSDDLLFTADGRTIGRLDPVFKRNMPILEAQIIQEDLDRIRVIVVPASGYSPDVRTLIGSEIRKRLGQVDVVVEEVAQIPRGANGKFRAVICNLANRPTPAPSSIES